MRKLLLLFTLALTGLGLFAQTNEFDREVGTATKGGQKILPQAGDYAIGVDAASFLKYAGNMFNGNTNNEAPSFDFTGGIFNAPTIYGKYFLQDNRAIRVKLHLAFNSKNDKSLVAAKPAPENQDLYNPAMVTDEVKTSDNGLGITAGYEFRRGYGRLQGFFGPEVGLGFLSSSKTYSYGNAMTEKYIEENGATTRPTKMSGASTFAMKVGGFAGVEYFVAPKISLGAELGIGVKYQTKGKSSIETDVWDATDKKVKNSKREQEGGNNFNFAAAYNAALNATFHF